MLTVISFPRISGWRRRWSLASGALQRVVPCHSGRGINMTTRDKDAPICAVPGTCRVVHADIALDSRSPTTKCYCLISNCGTTSSTTGIYLARNGMPPISTHGTNRSVVRGPLPHEINESTQQFNQVGIAFSTLIGPTNMSLCRNRRSQFRQRSGGLIFRRLQVPIISARQQNLWVTRREKQC